MLRPPVSRTLLLLVATSLFVPAAYAQIHDGPWAQLIEDPAGDVRTQPQNLGAPAAPKSNDMRTLRIQEAGSMYRFEFRSEEPNGFGSESLTSLVAFVAEDAEAGTRHKMEIRAQRDSPGIMIFRDGELLKDGPFSYNGHAWRYDAEIGRNLFTNDGTWHRGDRIYDVYAVIEDTQASPFALRDRAPDSGFGKEFSAERGMSEQDGTVQGGDGASGQNGVATEAGDVKWQFVAGDDFAAGPDVAVGPDGLVHVSYIQYRGDKGLHHGILQNGTLRDEKVADAAMLTDLHEDGNTQTGIDVDDANVVHIVYHPHPNGTSADAISYVRIEGKNILVESPNKVGSKTLVVEDGYRAVPAILAESNRVIVAFQTSVDRLAIVERTPQADWKLVRELDGRFANLALDSTGALHVAWFQEKTYEGVVSNTIYGELRYATEADAWKERTIAEQLTDNSKFWETSETDGSFAFALSPSDEPHFVWDNSTIRAYGILKAGQVQVSKSPLVPSHGNPQLRIRMEIDDDGYAHIVSGYGGSDLYATRGPKGDWTVQTFDRYDMFSLDLTSDDRAVVVHTQPHGGTTLAVAIADRRPGFPAVIDVEDEEEDESAVVFVPGPGIAIGILGGLGALSWVWLRGIDTAPRLLGASAAAIAGFSRLKKNELLDHETREEIVEAITSSPGRTAASVRKTLGLSRTTFFYHLRRLEQEGLIRVARRGAQLYLETPAIFAQRTEPATVEARIFRAALEAPGMAAADYALMLQLHERTVRHHLLSLERRGQLRSERASARNVHWFGDAGRRQN